MSSSKKHKHQKSPIGAKRINGNISKNSFVHQWLPPKGASAFFEMDFDDVYKRNHPIAYKLIVTLGLIAFMGPLVILGLVFMLNDPGKTNTSFALLGAFGAMIIGIGLFNFVAILMKQYLGHLLSILCFLIGGLMVFVCLRFLY